MALSLTLTLFLLLTLAQPCAHALSVSLWLSGSLLLSGSYSGSLWFSFQLTLALYPLLGSLRRCCVALVCPALSSSILLEAFLRHPVYRGQGGQPVLVLVPST